MNNVLAWTKLKMQEVFYQAKKTTVAPQAPIVAPNPAVKHSGSKLSSGNSTRVYVSRIYTAELICF